MRTIIVGGGKVGYYLVKALKEKKHQVVLIEKDIKICQKIAEEIQVDVICGDGSDVDVLKDAGIEEADVVAAVTGKDEENLVICQMAKVNFSINETIARINNPKNTAIFKALGVDKTVCSTQVICNLIEGEFNSEPLKVIETINKGEMILVEAKIDKDSAWKGKSIEQLKLPKECLILSIIRSEKVIFPRGSIDIKEGDKVLIITNTDRKNDVEKSIIGG
ncbi:TrkA family potassium uptake protein [Clostridium sp. CF012]|uniref:potassium channel family protein n=1 Tax=Clostridium sp. CF012 TaxID=2843319 RepID=UPI001C0B6938|nr:NAD-binding protein [Clostridium sp. CF012]MBU3146157.1 NAD-binding protein [Clostridium sp. CF012]